MPSSAKTISILLLSTLLMAACGIAYELSISSVSSYLLGNSITHFSITIGLFLSFMGVGSYLSKHIETHLFERFLAVELLLALTGGFSTALLYLAFVANDLYYVAAFLIIAALGTMIGFEIPLMTRIVAQYDTVKNSIAHVFSADYLGSLVASLLFSLLLLPVAGLMKSAFVIGAVNLGVACMTFINFRAHLQHTRLFGATLACTAIALGTGFLFAQPMVDFFEHRLYQDEIIYTAQTPYQRIVVTKYHDDLRLYLNGNLQFSSMDEHRYHEILVHIPLGISRNREHILVLGGGDGLAAREILKYPDVKSVTIVDIDKAMTDIAKTHPLFLKQNGSSLLDPRVTIVNEDAQQFLAQSAELYSAIIVDLPDPNDLSLGKLYSKEFYTLAKKRLAQDGVMITQATSPYFSREAFWCIKQTMSAIFPFTQPLTVEVPSFGQWGFVMAAHADLLTEHPTIAVSTRYLTQDILPHLFTFDQETNEIPVMSNTLDNQALVRYYEKAMETWYGSQ